MLVATAAEATRGRGHGRPRQSVPVAMPPRHPNLPSIQAMNLVEYIVRQKIYDSVYWKQHCFGLSAERLVDKAVELKYVGGMYGEPQKASEFVALILKMLQIQPDKEIIVEFIKNDDFKYLRLLGAFYMRLVGKAVDVYQYLEPLYNDYRKVRCREKDGSFALSHMDEVIDQMLRKDYLFDIALPRLPSRVTLERVGQLEPRISVLDEEFDEAALEEEAGDAAQAAAALEREMAREAEEQQEPRRRERSPWRLDPKEKGGGGSRHERSRSRDRDRGRDRDGERDRGRDDRRERERRDDRGRDEGRGERDYRDRDRDRRDERDRREDRDRRDGRDRREREHRDDRHADRDGRRDRDRDERRERRRDRSGSPGDRRDKKAKLDEDTEIAEANALRAKLGLKPLK
ncbi:hypothetical protein N2152v2_002303 [Parachlorella kessleri]